MQDTIAPDERLGEGDDVRLGGDTGSAVDDRVDAERLAHDGVEVRERVELICHVFRRTAKPGHVECRFSGSRESDGFWGRAESRIGRVLRSGKWFW
jgi:hypothetical protein